MEWLGSDDSLAKVVARRVQLHTNFDAVNAVKMQMEEDEMPPNPVGYQVVGNVAVISVLDATTNKSSWYTRYYGEPTYDDIMERFIEAFDDFTVKSVLLYLVTPGGEAQGVPGLSEFISSFNDKCKPVLSYTPSSMASAAVWYGTAAAALLADEWAMVGSIGAIVRFVDLTAMYEQMGIKNHIIRSAEWKGVPSPYEKFDKKGESVLKEGVERWHGRFVKGLSGNLGLSEETIQKGIANGKMFTSEEAVNLGLVKAIAPYHKVLATMNSKYQNLTAPATRPKLA